MARKPNYEFERRERDRLKAITFRSFGALPTDIILKGLITGSSVMAGTYAAKLLVERLSIATFQRLLDGVMLISGVALIWAAVR